MLEQINNFLMNTHVKEAEPAKLQSFGLRLIKTREISLQPSYSSRYCRTRNAANRIVPHYNDEDRVHCGFETLHYVTDNPVLQTGSKTDIHVILSIDVNTNAGVAQHIEGYPNMVRMCPVPFSVDAPCC
jgi:hypothetical protein